MEGVRNSYLLVLPLVPARDPPEALPAASKSQGVAPTFGSVASPAGRLSFGGVVRDCRQSAQTLNGARSYAVIGYHSNNCRDQNFQQSQGIAKATLSITVIRRLNCCIHSGNIEWSKNPSPMNLTCLCDAALCRAGSYAAHFPRPSLLN
jgi:hypothetical protein